MTKRRLLPRRVIPAKRSASRDLGQHVADRLARDEIPALHRAAHDLAGMTRLLGVAGRRALCFLPPFSVMAPLDGAIHPGDLVKRTARAFCEVQGWMPRSGRGMTVG